MKILPTRLLYPILKPILKALAYGTVGAVLVLLVVFVLYLDGRSDLSAWHTVDLDQEFTEDSQVTTFEEYLALEERLFAQLDELVYGADTGRERRLIARYDRGSLSDPGRWKPNWNRSFELDAQSPEAGVLLLHGMSDSPYSLRTLGQTLNRRGFSVLGLRLPGHGTAPAGLVEVRWPDMAAAVRLAVRHLKQRVGDRPVYIAGYSNGAALAVHYALSALEDERLPGVKGLVLVSPAIGVTPAAAFAVWQARLGHLLGLEKLAWNSILPEYDPFKYNSFAVNAGDQVYRLTREIQGLIGELGEAGKLGGFPPVLAFQSVVDATVSTPALVEGLFERLPPGGHELVLFDINRAAEIEPIMKAGVVDAVALLRDPDRTFTLSVLSNRDIHSRRVVVYGEQPGGAEITESDPGLDWPENIYSLAHVALPFPPTDPVYGGRPGEASSSIHLGDMALRGERGVLRVPASELLRLRWNPFYYYLESRALEFIGLDVQ
jgi:alpha-beta hydrolase superfamily lysophospholipase